MAEAAGLILFLVYTTFIFFIKEYYLIGIIFIINIIFMLVFKVKLKKGIIFLIKLLPFIIFTSILNILLGDINLGIFIGLKLILVCNITYIYSEKQTARKLQIATEKILMPLKLFKINPRDISVIVSISIAFIPIMKKELENLKYSLISKGFKINLKSFFTKPNCIFLPLIVGIIKKTIEIERSMISNGYMSL